MQRGSFPEPGGRGYGLQMNLSPRFTPLLLLPLFLAPLGCPSDDGGEEGAEDVGDTTTGDTTDDTTSETGDTTSETETTDDTTTDETGDTVGDTTDATDTSADEACAPGTQDCECAEGDVCDEGLECVEGVCIGSDAASCGWDARNSWYDCGFEGADPDMNFPIECPDVELVDGEPCPEELSDEGCCDGTQLWYCGMNGTTNINCEE